jgi:hypothetical protein
MALPVITNQPFDTTAYTGLPAMLGITATGALAYQWRKNGLDVSGAIDATYSIPSTYKSLEGAYKIHVSNVSGSVDSSSVQLTVLDFPLPQSWVVPNAVETIGSTGRKYKTRNAWVMDGTHNVPLGTQQTVDL